MFVEILVFLLICQVKESPEEAMPNITPETVYKQVCRRAV